MMTFFIFFITLLTVILYTLIGCITIPLNSAFIIDAIGHSIIAGIAIGFIIGKSLDSSLIFLGAISAALLMNLMVNFLKKDKNVEYDSSIGISFSFFFAIGILLISIYARNVHLDLDMILLGNIEFAIYDSIKFFNIMIPKCIFMLLFGLTVLLLFLYIYWNKINFILFDKEYSKTRGISFFGLNLFLIIYNSFIVVSSFNFIGALILTGIAAAPFGFAWKNSLSYKSFLIKSIIYTVLFGFLGCLAALNLDLPISATVAFFISAGSILKLFEFF